MKLEEQVLTIEQAKHLQELGMEMSDACFCWCKGLHYDDNYHFTFNSNILPEIVGTDSESIIPTYTLQEALSKLPKYITFNNEKFILEISLNPQASVYYFSVKDDDDYIQFTNKELFTALYRMLCWLLENGYLKEK